MFIKKRTILSKQSSKILHIKKANSEPSGWAMLQDVYMVKKKLNLIMTEEKIVLKNYVKNEKSVQ